MNHVSGAAKRGVAGVCNLAEYFKERRRALEYWARHLLKQVDEARRVVLGPHPEKTTHRVALVSAGDSEPSPRNIETTNTK